MQQLPVTNATSGTAFNTTNTTFFVGTTANNRGRPPAIVAGALRRHDSQTGPADRCESSNLTITD